VVYSCMCQRFEAAGQRIWNQELIVNRPRWDIGSVHAASSSIGLNFPALASTESRYRSFVSMRHATPSVQWAEISIAAMSISLRTHALRPASRFRRWEASGRPVQHHLAFLGEMAGTVQRVEQDRSLRATEISTREIARREGVSEGAVRKRAKAQCGISAPRCSLRREHASMARRSESSPPDCIHS